MSSLARSSSSPRRRRSDGRQTHAAILDAATRVASVDGINALTIGGLAEILGVSKSGLFAHFGSKEQLQLETIHAAWSIFEREVLQPASEAPEGIERLRAMCESYLAYVERQVFPGGCFFASLVAEMDARSGAVHELAVSIEKSIGDGMANLVRQAQRRGEVKRSVDPLQLAFELEACVELANYHFILFGNRKALDRGRNAVTRLLDQARTRRRGPG